MSEGQIGQLWPKPNPVTELTYWVTGYPAHTDCPQEEVRNILADACQRWQNVSGFSFIRAGNERDADIVFRFGTVGKRDRLAECTPGTKDSWTAPHLRTAVITFDDTRIWTSQRHNAPSPWLLLPVVLIAKLSQTGRYDLLAVAVHEIGHALSLGHDTTHPESVMQPTITEVTGAYFLTGRQLPNCDAEALGREWGLSIEPSEPHGPAPAGYVVVGGRMEVTNRTSSITAKADPDCSWGTKGEDHLVGEGYCWNRFKDEGGYGRIYFHLAAKGPTSPSTSTLLGGHTEYRQMNSKGPRWKGPSWGVLDVGDGQLLGHMEGWNPHLNRGRGGDGYLRFFGTVGAFVGELPYTLPVLGGRTEIWKAGSRPTTRYSTNVWGETDGGTEIPVAEGHTHSARKGYDRAFMASYLRVAS